MDLQLLLGLVLQTVYRATHGSSVCRTGPLLLACFGRQLFTARLRGRCSSCISRPLPPTASATVSVPLRTGTSAITDDPTQTCHYRAESTVHSRVTPGIECPMGSDKRMTRTHHERHAEKSHCPKSPLSSTCPLLPSNPVTPTLSISRMSPSWSHRACHLLAGLSLTDVHQRLRQAPCGSRAHPFCAEDLLAGWTAVRLSITG